jgi:hypothetical protein
MMLLLVPLLVCLFQCYLFKYSNHQTCFSHFVHTHTQKHIGRNFARLSGIIVLTKDYLQGAVSVMLNNSFINEKFMHFVNTGERTLPPLNDDCSSNAVVTTARQQQYRRQMNDRRDPILVGFEKHLLEKLAKVGVDKMMCIALLFTLCMVMTLLAKA